MPGTPGSIVSNPSHPMSAFLQQCYTEMDSLETSHLLFYLFSFHTTLCQGLICPLSHPGRARQALSALRGSQDTIVQVSNTAVWGKGWKLSSLLGTSQLTSPQQGPWGARPQYYGSRVIPAALQIPSFPDPFGLRVWRKLPPIL